MRTSMGKMSAKALRKDDGRLGDCDETLTGLRLALDKVIAPALMANLRPCPERREEAHGVSWGYADPEAKDGFRYVFGMVAYPGQEPGCECLVFSMILSLPLSEMLVMFLKDVPGTRADCYAAVLDALDRPETLDDLFDWSILRRMMLVISD